MAWIRDRALTLLLLTMFAIFLVGQLLTGWREFNATQVEHRQSRVSMTDYLATGHPWEALFENWESEFLQMAVFVLLTTVLVQKGSAGIAPARREGAGGCRPARLRRTIRMRPGRSNAAGGFCVLYENSLGLVFVVLFLLSWAGHAAGGFAESVEDQVAHGLGRSSWTEYLASPRFWFESFQNWQSEFLAIAAMVWLAVYLRQRWSPESKPVHAPHSDTGR